MTAPRSPGRAAPRALRCAIYTRKSTEQGLEQEFNSLHNQREAAEAYIQKPGARGLAPACLPLTTTVAPRAAAWTGRPCSGSWPRCGPAAST